MRVFWLNVLRSNDMEYFSDDELRCKCGCQRLVFCDNARSELNKIREALGVPMVISSAYRCEDHPVERAKLQGGSTNVGAHSRGKAVDVAISGDNAMRLVTIAYQHGVRRIGVKQKGAARFIHLDWCDEKELPTPAFWSY